MNKLLVLIQGVDLLTAFPRECKSAPRVGRAPSFTLSVGHMGAETLPIEGKANFTPSTVGSVPLSQTHCQSHIAGNTKPWVMGWVGRQTGRVQGQVSLWVHQPKPVPMDMVPG